MTDKRAISQALDALEALHGQIGAITARTDDGRKLELVHKRRELAEHLATVARLADTAFAAGGDTDLALAYRSRFSNLRSKMAMHQAEWPAVSLGSDDEAFRGSARLMREANREFMRWMREALDRL